MPININQVTLENVASTCQVNGVSLVTGTATAGPDGAGTPLYVNLQTRAGAVVQTANGESPLDFSFEDAANDIYDIYTSDNSSGNNATQRVLVDCAGSGTPAPGGCSIALADVLPVSPTTPGGYGAISYRVTGIQSSQAEVVIYDYTGSAYVDKQQRTTASPTGVFGGLLAGKQYHLWAYEQGTPTDPYTGPPCRTPDSIVDLPAAPAPPVGPVLPPAYYPVGGVQPNPVLLPAAVGSLTDATTGLPRAGLHLELELRRAGVAGATFATARKTVRKLAELVDVAAYLRPQLRTLQGYLPNTGLVRDANTAFAFAYRYREVDNLATGPWVDCPNPNYAVLAAQPPTALALDIVAEVASGCAWAPAMPSGAAVQFVGYPAEVGIIIPDRAPGLPTWLEAVYSDAAGNTLEVRAWEVLATAPAGYYRICLPQDPLPCAASLYLAICNEDRHFAGSCSGVVIPPLPTPGHIIVGKGYLLRN